MSVEGLEKERTRRNIIRMGAIGASAIFASLGTMSRATAQSAPAVASTRPRPRNCFLSGTTIRTADGSRNVEDLAIGDPLPTMFGGTRPIQWIARYLLRKAIRRGPGRKMRARFGSLALLSRPTFPKPIFM